MTTQQKNQKDLAPSHPSYPLIIRLGDDDHDAPESFPTSLQKILILQVFRHVTSNGLSRFQICQDCRRPLGRSKWPKLCNQWPLPETIRTQFEAKDRQYQTRLEPGWKR